MRDVPCKSWLKFIIAIFQAFAAITKRWNRLSTRALIIVGVDSLFRLAAAFILTDCIKILLKFPGIHYKVIASVTVGPHSIMQISRRYLQALSYSRRCFLLTA